MTIHCFQNEERIEREKNEDKVKDRRERKRGKKMMMM